MLVLTSFAKLHTNILSIAKLNVIVNVALGLFSNAHQVCAPGKNWQWVLVIYDVSAHDM